MPIADFALNGIIYSCITPFDDERKLDLQSLRNLCSHLHVTENTGIFTGGASGENALLSIDERMLFLQTVSEETAGKIPLIAHCSANTPDETNAMIDFVRDLNVDAITVDCRFGSGFSKQETFSYYLNLAERIEDSSFYIIEDGSVPVSDMVELMEDLMDANSNFTGLIQGSADIIQTMKYLRSNNMLDVLITDDNLAFPSFAMGATALISDYAIVFPYIFNELWRSFLSGSFDICAEMQQSICIMRDMLSNYHPATIAKVYLKQKGVLESCRCRIPRIIDEAMTKQILDAIEKVYNSFQ